MSQYYYYFPLLVTIFALNTACFKTVQSEDIATSEIYLSMDAVATEEGQTDLLVALKTAENSNNYIKLGENENLSVSFAEDKVAMQASESFGAVHYSSSFNTIDENASFIVSLERTGFENATQSSVSLPAPFDISAPEADAHFVPGVNDIVIVWSNYDSDDQMFLQLNGSCMTKYEQELSDFDGIFTIYPGDLEFSDTYDSAECAATLTMERKRVGTVDAALAGGDATAIQRRETEIVFIF